MKRKYEIAVLSMGGYARTVRIYAPKKTDRAVIMHDGQNVFDDSTAAFGKSWRVLDTLKRCAIKNTAIIGIDSVATRDDDYMPFPSELENVGIKKCGGNAGMYADYIERIIIPYLDKRFGFEFYGMLGSSAGALATLTVAARKNARIKAYGMYSTPLFVSASAFDRYLPTASFDANAFYHVYVGGNEVTGEVPENLLQKESQLFVDDSFKLTNALRAGGAQNIRLDMINSAGHDELAWRVPSTAFFSAFASLQKPIVRQ